MTILRPSGAIRVRKRGVGVIDRGAPLGRWGYGEAEEIRTEEEDGAVGGVIDGFGCVVLADGPDVGEAWIGQVDAGEDRATEAVFGGSDVDACCHGSEDGDDSGGRGGAEEGAVGLGFGGEHGGLQEQVAEV